MTKLDLSDNLSDLSVKKNDTLYFVAAARALAELSAIRLYGTDLGLLRKKAEALALEGYEQVQYGCLLGTCSLKTTVVHSSPTV